MIGSWTKGREFTEKEVSNYAQVAVLGATAAETIFNDVDAVGKTVIF